MNAKSTAAVLLLVAGVFSLTSWCSPALALVLGAAIALSVGNPYTSRTRPLTKQLLQLSIVLLGFGMDLGTVLRTGRDGLWLTACTITITMVIGMSLARLLSIARAPALLICVGTAICGGSAIAAVAPVIEAEDDETSISLSTVFLLNAVGLLIFPPIGSALHLTQHSFGVWAALAIHDTSSVVGAAARYGSVALMVGTTVKLARALWIVPVTLTAAAYKRSRWWQRSHVLDAEVDTSEDTPGAKVTLPWFILFYLAAAAVASYWHPHATAWSALSSMGKRGLSLALFLIGAGMTRSALKKVGARPMIFGLLLWIVAASISIFIVMRLLS